MTFEHSPMQKKTSITVMVFSLLALICFKNAWGIESIEDKIEDVVEEAIGGPVTIMSSTPTGSSPPVNVYSSGYQQQCYDFDVTFTCPPGTIIKSIPFSSYGEPCPQDFSNDYDNFITPIGDCTTYEYSWCNAENSLSYVQQTCIGLATCTFYTQAFGDPCFNMCKTYRGIAECVTGSVPPTVQPSFWPTIAPTKATNASCFASFQNSGYNISVNGVVGSMFSFPSPSTVNVTVNLNSINFYNSNFLYAGIVGYDANSTCQKITGDDQMYSFDFTETLTTAGCYQIFVYNSWESTCGMYGSVTYGMNVAAIWVESSLVDGPYSWFLGSKQGESCNAVCSEYGTSCASAVNWPTSRDDMITIGESLGNGAPVNCSNTWDMVSAPTYSSYYWEGRTYEYCYYGGGSCGSIPYYQGFCPCVTRAKPKPEPETTKPWKRSRRPHIHKYVSRSPNRGPHRKTKRYPAPKSGTN